MSDLTFIDSQELANAIRKLMPEEAEVIFYRFVELRKFREIADVVGVSPRTVGRRVQSGIERLRKALAEPVPVEVS